MKNLNELTTETTYSSLFQFISKNKSLPRKVDEISTNSPKLIELQSAIERPHFESPIFDDEEVDILLLRLFKDNKISSSTFLSVYNYLMACMQFGNLPVKAEDSKEYKRKLENRPKMVPLFIDGSLNQIFAGKIESLISRLKQISSIKISSADIILDYLKKLPAAEQYLIYINFNREEKQQVKWSLPSDLFFSMKQWDDNIYYFSPTITQYLQSLMFEEPMKLLPGFGSVGNQILNKLHSQNLHFFPLYNRQIRHNLTAVHAGQYQGPFVVAQHDNYHSLTSSLFQMKDREYLCATLPRLLTETSSLSEDDLMPLLYGDHSFSDLDPGSYGYLVDFTALPTGEERLINYLSSMCIIFINEQLKNQQSIAEPTIPILLNKDSKSYQTIINLIKRLTDLCYLQSNDRRDMLKKAVDDIAAYFLDADLEHLKDEDKKELFAYYLDKTTERKTSSLFSDLTKPDIESERDDSNNNLRL